MTLRHWRFFDEVLSEGTWRRNGKLPSSFRQQSFVRRKARAWGHQPNSSVTSTRSS